MGDAVPVRRESARAVALAPPPLHRAAWVSRFLDKVDVSGTGCWLWTASRFPGGYGQFAIARHPHLAHRIAYELFLGPIRTGHQIHHDCEVKTCVNPLHLQSLTVAEHNALHARRRRAAKASAAAQTAVMA